MKTNEYISRHFIHTLIEVKSPKYFTPVRIQCMDDIWELLLGDLTSIKRINIWSMFSREDIEQTLFALSFERWRYYVLRLSEAKNIKEWNQAMKGLEPFYAGIYSSERASFMWREKAMLDDLIEFIIAQ